MTAPALPSRPDPAMCASTTTRTGEPCRTLRFVVEYMPSPFTADGVRYWQLSGCRTHAPPTEMGLAYLADRDRDHRERAAEAVLLLRDRLAAAEASLRVADSQSRSAETDLRRVRAAEEPACWDWFRDVHRPGLPSPAILADLEVWQQGCCAICGDALPLVTDHDHWSGFVRGFLCRECNRQEGGHYPAVGMYAGYRQWHPAKFFGLLAPHYSGLRGETKYAGNFVPPQLEPAERAELAAVRIAAARMGDR